MRFKYFLFFILGLLLATTSCVRYSTPEQKLDISPVIYPDYSGITFPPNITAPNFLVKEDGDAYHVEIGQSGLVPSIVITQKSSHIIIPLKKWRKLLNESMGGDIYFKISVRNQNIWTNYADVINHISDTPINSHLAYRLLYPGYELWNEMGIFQRDLTSYEQTAIADNRDFDGQCVNCHNFTNNSPETMMLHIRGKDGGTLIYKDGKVEKVNLSPDGYRNGSTYPSWHPSARYIAFSMNNVQQFFHSSGQKQVEVSDLEADIIVYDTESNRIFTDSLLFSPDYMQTFPSWSRDGKTLFFTRAHAYEQGMALDSIRYDLCSIDFDMATETFSNFKVLYDARSIGKTVSHPRLSPDGRYLMFTRFDYGNFSIWHPESDLYLMDLTDHSVRAMDEVNSDNVDSYHTWDSSGKWFVFSSKRMDGLWSRPYFASFDSETGMAGKPFLLPQKQADYYDTYTRTFNVPELIDGPVKHSKDLLDAIPTKAKEINY